MPSIVTKDASVAAFSAVAPANVGCWATSTRPEPPPPWGRALAWPEPGSSVSGWYMTPRLHVFLERVTTSSRAYVDLVFREEMDVVAFGVWDVSHSSGLSLDFFLPQLDLEPGEYCLRFGRGVQQSASEPPVWLVSTVSMFSVIDTPPHPGTVVRAPLTGSSPGPSVPVLGPTVDPPKNAPEN